MDSLSIKLKQEQIKLENLNKIISNEEKEKSNKVKEESNSFILSEGKKILNCLNFLFK
jgi:hypothetical protein